MRYSMALSPEQVEKAWGQVQQYFRECATCGQIVCLSDFRFATGMCKEDSPRRGEIAEAEAEQAAGVIKGFAQRVGLGDALKGIGEAARRAAEETARCPNDGTLAAAGTKFCPQCGSPMIQPAADSEKCPGCGAETRGAKFCPECGAKIERAAAATSVCPSCGAEAKGAKFCPECGTKIV